MPITLPKPLIAGGNNIDAPPVMGVSESQGIESIGNFGLGVFRVAREQYWLDNLIERESESLGFEADPEWKPDLAAWEKWSKTVDEDLRLDVLSARSQDHYNFLAHEATQSSLRRKILRDAGYGGTIATIVAQMADPVNLLGVLAGPWAAAGRTGAAAYVSAGAVNAALGLVTEGTRAGLSEDLTYRDAVLGAAGDFLFGANIARANAAGAGVAARSALGFGSYAAPTAFSESLKEDSDILDIGMAGVVAGLMGAGLGAAAKTPEASAWDNASTRIRESWRRNRANFQKTGKIESTAEFPPDFVETMTQVQPNDWADMRMATAAGKVDNPVFIKPEQADLSALAASIRAGGEGQTQSPTFQNTLLRADFKPGDMDASRVSLSPATTTLFIKDFDTKVPITMSMTAWASKDATDLRGTWFANATGTNYVPHKDGSVNRGLIEQRDSSVQAKAAEFNTGLASVYRTERKNAQAAGVDFPNEEEWLRQVTRVAATGNATGAAPGVADAAAKLAQYLDAELDYYLRHEGLTREDAGNIKYYVPNIDNRQRLDALVKAIGHDRAVRFYANAILSDMQRQRAGANQAELFPDMTPEQIAAKDDKLAMRMAEAKIKYGGTKSGRVYAAGMSRAEGEKLLDEIADLSPDDKKHLLRNLFGKEEAANSRLRARTPIDRTYSEVIDGVTYRIEDLLENDPRVLFGRYSHEMRSGAALAEAARVYKAQFGEDMPRTLAEFERDVPKWYAPGASSTSRAIALFRQLAGYAVHDIKDELDNALMASSYVIQGATYMQVMATPRAGAIQITESINHLVQPELSVPFMLRHFPVIKEIFGLAKSNELADYSLIADAHLRGRGVGHAARIPGHVMDGSVGYAQKFGPVVTGVEKVTHFGSKYMALEQPIGDAQAVSVDVGAVGHWIDYATGKTGPLSERRLKAINLTPDLQEEIAVMIRRHGAKNEKGQIVHPNETAWTNQAAAAAFREANWLNASRALNYGDTSSMPTFAAKWYGKLFLQLRRYALRATGNYGGFNARMADRHAALSFIASSASGMMSYVVATLIGSALQPDREAFLEERLSTENIAKAAIARGAMMGILPTVVDAGAATLGYNPPFAQYRQQYMATGGSGVLANFAAMDSLKSLTAVPGAVLRPIIEDDYAFSERNYNTITKGLFLPNYMGILRYIRDEMNLPARSE